MSDNEAKLMRIFPEASLPDVRAALAESDGTIDGAAELLGSDEWRANRRSIAAETARKMLSSA